jgi:NADPH:quinone reductase-like Zn-dependent oxidoreductase
VFGNSSKERSTIDFRDFAGRDRVRLQSFFSAHYEHRAADNLRTLLQHIRGGRLDVEIGLEVPLAEVNDALDALDQRRVRGKAILRIEA